MKLGAKPKTLEEIEAKIKRAKIAMYSLGFFSIAILLFWAMPNLIWLYQNGRRFSVACYAVLYSLMFGMFAFMYWWGIPNLRKRLIRQLPDHCRVCGYDLIGNLKGICPECGSKNDVPTKPSVSNGL